MNENHLHIENAVLDVQQSTQENKPFRGWIASLSNGETVHEWYTGPAERSAWKHLISRLISENLKITQLRLQIGKLTLTTLPNAEGYVVLNQIRSALYTKKTTMTRGIGAVEGNGVVMMWADTNGNVWQDVYPLEKVLEHSSLRDDPHYI